MRLLRAGPQRRAVLPRIDHGAGRAHAGMRLERPFAFRLDDPRGTGEGRVDFPSRNRHLTLDDGRLTDVVVECGIFGKGRAALDARNVADRALVDATGTGPGGGSSGHAASPGPRCR
jgi:hypothetical protein